VEDLVTYASFGRGSKSGGLQSNPTTLEVAPYEGEVAESIELGAKYAGSNYNLAAALYRSNIRGFQFGYSTLVGNPASLQFIIDNADVRSQGVELSGRMRPAGGLTIEGAVTYTDAVSKSLLPPPPAVPVLVPGERMRAAPEWSGNAGVTYLQQVGRTLDATFGTDIEFGTKQYTQSLSGGNYLSPPQKGYVRLNARLAVADSDTGIEVALMGRNLFDTRRVVFASSIPQTGSSAVLSSQAFYGTLMSGRELVIQLTMRR
jgi:outer membrane receptor protein involved in Fe transport